VEETCRTGGSTRKELELLPASGAVGREAVSLRDLTRRITFFSLGKKFREFASGEASTRGAHRLPWTSPHHPPRRRGPYAKALTARRESRPSIVMHPCFLVLLQGARGPDFSACAAVQVRSENERARG
jgi:hypothetical protein